MESNEGTPNLKRKRSNSDIDKSHDSKLPKLTESDSYSDYKTPPEYPSAEKSNPPVNQSLQSAVKDIDMKSAIQPTITEVQPLDKEKSLTQTVAVEVAPTETMSENAESEITIKLEDANKNDLETLDEYINDNKDPVVRVDDAVSDKENTKEALTEKVAEKLQATESQNPENHADFGQVLRIVN